MVGQILGRTAGRPPLNPSVWNRVVDLLERGKTPQEISEDCGIGLTKVYEIRRNPVRKPIDDLAKEKAPGSSTATGH